MEKKGICSYCGKYDLIADYGYNRAYICIDCSLSSKELSDHVAKEMVRRHGRAKIEKIVADNARKTRVYH